MYMDVMEDKTNDIYCICSYFQLCSVKCLLCWEVMQIFKMKYDSNRIRNRLSNAATVLA